MDACFRWRRAGLRRSPNPAEGWQRYLKKTDRHRTLGRGFIAAPGCLIIFVAAGLSLAFWFVEWTALALLGLAGAFFLVYFFRNPRRTIPDEEAAIVAPADGKVIRVDELQETEFLHVPARRVAIFMNVFDVHVNRAPVAGRVVVSRHFPGRFLAAFKEAAERANERLATVLEMEDGRRVLVVQIAGLLARRIIVSVEEGEVLAQGEPFGMICFGSRVDLYLPLEARVLVKVGDRVLAGESVVGRWT